MLVDSDIIAAFNTPFPLSLNPSPLGRGKQPIKFHFPALTRPANATPRQFAAYYFTTKTVLMHSLPMNRRVIILSVPSLIQGFMDKRKGAKTQRRKGRLGLEKLLKWFLNRLKTRFFLRLCGEEPPLQRGPCTGVRPKHKSLGVTLENHRQNHAKNLFPNPLSNLPHAVFSFASLRLCAFALKRETAPTIQIPPAVRFATGLSPASKGDARARRLRFRGSMRVENVRGILSPRERARVKGNAALVNRQCQPAPKLLHSAFGFPLP